MQFDNSANPDAHRKTTALEIARAITEIGKPLGAFVATSGTGGTITGTGEALKELYPNMTVHVVEPAGSPFCPAAGLALTNLSAQAPDSYQTF